MDRGFFGDLFDLDHNGELDSREQLLDFMAFEEMSKVDEGDEENDDMADLDMAGLDFDELADMDEDVSYEGSIREDALFNFLRKEKFEIAGVEVDINPITE